MDYWWFIEIVIWNIKYFEMGINEVYWGKLISILYFGYRDDKIGYVINTIFLNDTMNKWVGFGGVS